MQVNVKVYNQNLKRRLRRIEKKLDRDGTLVTKDIARMVAIRSAIAAPKETTKLADFIKITPMIRRDVKEYIVGYPNDGMGANNPHPEKKLKGGQEFSLPRWMQPALARATTQAKYHPWTTGHRNFLQIGSNQTRAEFGNRIRKVVQDALSIKVK